jgi:hypothetical protein
MKLQYPCVQLLSGLLSAAVGILLTTASPVAIAITAFIPALWMAQPTRRGAFIGACCYYAGALWPVIPAVNTFLASDHPAAGTWHSGSLGAILWAGGAVTLSLTWPILWTADRRQLLWRAPVAGLLVVLPPLGLIGVASPLAAAGFLFPAMKFVGLFAVLLAPGVIVSSPRTGTALLLAAALVANLLYSGTPKPPADWQAINTVSEDGPNDDYGAISKTLGYAESSNARVVVLPEGALRQWTGSAESFFQSRLSALGARGQTLLAGAIVPADSLHRGGEVNFAEQLKILRGAESFRAELPSVHLAPNSDAAYCNGMVALGNVTAVVPQRVPVPLGMWKPFTRIGVPLNLAGDGILRVAGQRAAVLICYEQLLVWPAVVSMLHRPSLIVGIANDHWVKQTPIPELQQMYLQSWSRLSDLPIISASNR